MHSRLWWNHFTFHNVSITTILKSTSVTVVIRLYIPQCLYYNQQFPVYNLLFTPLHSTMSLLQPGEKESSENTENRFTFHNVSITTWMQPGRFLSRWTLFTFHNVSITTFYDDRLRRSVKDFTFHNVSITTQSLTGLEIRLQTLHSTMSLLQPRFGNIRV